MKTNASTSNILENLSFGRELVIIVRLLTILLTILFKNVNPLHAVRDHGFGFRRM